MQAARLQTVEAIFDQAVLLESSLQERFVRSRAGDDDELVEDVLSLLRADSPETLLSLRLALIAAGSLRAARSIGYEESLVRSPVKFFESASSAVRISLHEFCGRMGSYQILEQIGKGGMGVVYRAYDEARQRFVALKTLQSTRAAKLEDFKKEFRLFQGLSHPNLVPLYELIEDEGRWCFTMELIEGRSLLEYIAGSSTGVGDPDPSKLKRLHNTFRQLASAVAAIHNAGKLHRDLKPSNALVKSDETVVLLDFGLGVELDTSGRHENTADHLVGSIPYMSPEQACSGNVSAASDWYSFGVILYQALTGQLPFRGSLLEVLQAKTKRDGGAPAAINPFIPEDLNALCMDLLRRNPADRPAAAAILDRFGTRPEHLVETARLREDLFVGRQTELESMAKAYKRSRLKPVIVFVRGQSGAGKTSLVQRFLSDISSDPDVIVLTGRCLEQESVPFKALDSLVDCLVRRLRKMKGEQLDAVMPREIRALACVFPAFSDFPAPPRAPSIPGRLPKAGNGNQEVNEDATLDPVDLRHRAAKALQELLARLGDRHPLVLFIDDLQWGDNDSASLLMDVMTPPDSPNFLGIGCYRSEDAANSPFLAALQEFQRRTRPSYEETQISVGMLAPDEARELARRILPTGQRSPEALVDEIARESAGRPFLVYELIEYLGASGEGSIESTSLALNDVLWKRIEALSPENRRFLELVAIAGRPIEEIATYNAAGLSMKQTAVVAYLRAARLIRGTPAGRGNYVEVYHDRIRQVIAEHLLPATIEDHHRRLARVFSTSDDADAEQLAVHLNRGGLHEEAAEYYWQAANKATKALAFDHAAAMYRQALALKAWAVDQQREIKIQLGDALSNAGRGREASEEYLAAADYAQPALALDLQSRAALALLTTGHVDEGLSRLRPVMKVIGTQLARTPMLALLGLLARRIQLRIRGTRFIERGEDSIEIDELRRIDVGWSVVLGLSVIDPIRGAHFQARSLLLALRAGEPYRLARAFAVEAAHLASSGDVKRASAILSQAERLALRLQRQYTSGFVELARGVVAYFDQKWSKSVQCCRSAAATFRLHCPGAIREIDTCNAFTLGSLAKMGSIAELGRISPALLKQAHDRGDLYAIANVSTQIMSMVRMARNEPEIALSELTCVMAQWSQSGYHVQHHDALLAFVPLEMYMSRPEAAWDRVGMEWSRFRRSLLSHVQDLRIEMLQLRAFSALAMAQQSKNRQMFVAAARSDAKRLRRERLPWTHSLADYIEGAAAFLAGNPDEARARLSAAVAGFDVLEVRLHAAVTRARLALLCSGDEAAQLHETAREWMRGEGIVDSERMIQAYAPGFPSEARPDRIKVTG